MSTFGLILLENVWAFLFSQLWNKNISIVFFFYKDAFGMRRNTVDMPLNIRKQTKKSPWYILIAFLKIVFFFFHIKKKMNMFSDFSKQLNYILVSTSIVFHVTQPDWLVKWVLWHINLCRLFNAKSILIQIISSFSNNLV